MWYRVGVMRYRVGEMWRWVGEMWRAVWSRRLAIAVVVAGALAATVMSAAVSVLVLRGPVEWWLGGRSLLAGLEAKDRVAAVNSARQIALACGGSFRRAGSTWSSGRCGISAGPEASARPGSADYLSRPAFRAGAACRGCRGRRVRP